MVQNFQHSSIWVNKFPDGQIVDMLQYICIFLFKLFVEPTNECSLAPLHCDKIEAVDTESPFRPVSGAVT